MNCVVMAILCDNQILLQKRENVFGIKYPGYWAIPGGGVEVGETVIEALEREFEEEIIIDSNTNVQFQFIGNMKNEWDSYEYVFIVNIVDGKNVKCTEGEECGFFNIESELVNQLQLPIHHQKILDLVINYYKNNKTNFFKEVNLMKLNVKDYVSVTKLGKEKKPQQYEETGEGYIINKGKALTALYHNGLPMECLAYIEFEPGKSRGDHYHMEKVENMCVVKGSISAKYMLPDSPDDVLELVLEAGDIVHIFPGCAHSYMANEWSVALEFSPQKFKMADTIDVDFSW